MVSPKSPEIVVNAAALLWERQPDELPEHCEKLALQLYLHTLMRLDVVRLKQTGFLGMQEVPLPNGLQTPTRV
jgi:hypothetical protein